MTYNAGTGTYTVALIDAIPGGTVNPFGSFSGGTATGNPASTADGAYTIRAADPAGNTATVGSFTLDTTVPTTGTTGGIDITPATDTGANDTTTANGTPTLTFTGEAGLTITIQGPDGKPLPAGAYTVVENPDGTYTTTLLDATPGNGTPNPFGDFFGVNNPTGNPPGTGDGTYTLQAADNAGNTTTIGNFVINTRGLDNDGADDTFEAGKDGNSDGIDDSLQKNVATIQTFTGAAATLHVLALETAEVVDTANGGKLSSVTYLDFGGIEEPAESITGTDRNTIDQIQELLNSFDGSEETIEQLGLPPNAELILASSDQLKFSIFPEIIKIGSVDPSLEATFRNDVASRFQSTIQQVDLYYGESDTSLGWNALIKSDGKGGDFFFGYDPVTGIGGILLDRNNNGKVDGARLYLKDNERGDLDPTPNRIEDPVTLVALAANPTLQVSDDGQGLRVVGFEGTGLWLDFSVITANGNWQNSLDLLTSTGEQLGSIGATPNSGVLGRTRIFLEAGQELRFDLFSRNNTDLPGNLQITAQGEGLRLTLEDGGSSDNDFNDLVIDITGSLTVINSDINNLRFALEQRSSDDALMDLTSIAGSSLTLNLEVTTDTSFTNRIGFVKLDRDSLTGAVLNSVNGVAASAGDAFRTTVRDNLINPDSGEVKVGGQGTQTFSWTIFAADAGYYAPVMIAQTDEVFTLGSSTGSDRQQHVKVLGTNTFGFEDLLASQGSDWDYNDVVVRVTTSF